MSQAYTGGLTDAQRAQVRRIDQLQADGITIISQSRVALYKAIQEQGGDADDDPRIEQGDYDASIAWQKLDEACMYLRRVVTGRRKLPPGRSGDE